MVEDILLINSSVNHNTDKKTAWILNNSSCPTHNFYFTLNFWYFSCIILLTAHISAFIKVCSTDITKRHLGAGRMSHFVIWSTSEQLLDKNNYLLQRKRKIQHHSKINVVYLYFLLGNKLHTQLLSLQRQVQKMSQNIWEIPVSKQSAWLFVSLSSGSASVVAFPAKEGREVKQN